MIKSFPSTDPVAADLEMLEASFFSQIFELSMAMDHRREALKCLDMKL